MNYNNLDNKYIEFENTEVIRKIKNISSELIKIKKILQKTNTKDKSILLEAIESNLKKLTNAHNRFFDAFFNKFKLDLKDDTYITINKMIANEAIEEVDKSTKEISKNLSDFCVDESKRFLDENSVDIASNYLDDALLLDINNAVAYYYLCLIALVKNKLTDALINVKKAIKLNFNKKFCMHYLKVIKEKINQL